MVGKKDLTKQQIKAIISLYKAERSVKEIEKTVSVMRCVKKWLGKFREDGGMATLEYKKRPGKGHNT